MLQLHIISEFINFADETVLLYTASTWKQLKEKIEIDFPKISYCLQINILTLNLNKTDYISFTSYGCGLPNFLDLILKFLKPKKRSTCVYIIEGRHMRRY